MINQAQFTGLIQETLWVMLLLSGPILIVSTLVGTVVSVLQAVTQIQEQALAFIPKLLVVLAMKWVLLPWMTGLMLDHCRRLFELMIRMG
jgi:flagellar biosynthesis protein FliQ